MYYDFRPIPNCHVEREEVRLEYEAVGRPVITLDSIVFRKSPFSPKSDRYLIAYFTYNGTDYGVSKIYDPKFEDWRGILNHAVLEKFGIQLPQSELDEVDPCAH